MKIVNGEFRIEIMIDSYEFPYHENNTYHDNNWLNVKAICEDDVLVDEGIEPCLLASELRDLYQGLSKVLKKQSYHSVFIEPNLGIDVEPQGDQVKFSMRFHKKNKDHFQVEAMYTMEELDEMVSEIKKMVDSFPVRENKIYT